ncbi:ABC-type dipeptide/oligopeptide/nickel transport system, ATP-binding protein [Staphylococcus aureus]|uniref:ABC-type dipeptide/oligopeptide/nickel transport system, ATP-binding protein n=1 Tax=Staphylococcus aureus TaxID=1280 RepID=A0A380EIX2_STAAU|nr:ABC-type dipeptide/oligopeptide/nickel transport system, ATP-binding protein [Staphylococcus aureus]
MIELKHVTFGYNKKQMVLQDINLLYLMEKMLVF